MDPHSPDRVALVCASILISSLLFCAAYVFAKHYEYESRPDVVAAEAHQKELLEKQRCPTCHRLPER